jgi:hypothetical protein
VLYYKKQNRKKKIWRISREGNHNALFYLIAIKEIEGKSSNRILGTDELC